MIAVFSPDNGAADDPHRTEKPAVFPPEVGFIR